MTFGAYVETLRTIASIADVGRQLLGDTDHIYYRAFGYDRDIAPARDAHNVMVWLLVGYRLGDPWRTLAWAVITGRHRVGRR
jgi:hypothetical protein